VTEGYAILKNKKVKGDEGHVGRVLFVPDVHGTGAGRALKGRQK